MSHDDLDARGRGDPGSRLHVALAGATRGSATSRTCRGRRGAPRGAPSHRRPPTRAASVETSIGAPGRSSSDASCEFRAATAVETGRRASRTRRPISAPWLWISCMAACSEAIIGPARSRHAVIVSTSRLIRSLSSSTARSSSSARIRVDSMMLATACSATSITAASSLAVEGPAVSCASLGSTDGSSARSRPRSAPDSPRRGLRARSGEPAGRRQTPRAPCSMLCSASAVACSRRSVCWRSCRSRLEDRLGRTELFLLPEDGFLAPRSSVCTSSSSRRRGRPPPPSSRARRPLARDPPSASRQSFCAASSCSSSTRQPVLPSRRALRRGVRPAAPPRSRSSRHGRARRLAR